MDERHPVKACNARLESPPLPLRLSRQADLLTGLVFIPYLRDAYQTQPQTWPGLGLHCLSDCCSLGWSTADVFAPRGLSVEAAAQTTANKVHVQQNRSRCLLTCLSLAFLQGREERAWVLEQMSSSGRALHTPLHFLYLMKNSIMLPVCALALCHCWIMILIQMCHLSPVSQKFVK